MNTAYVRTTPKYLRRKVCQGFDLIIEVSVWTGNIALAAIILITFIDVCGRYFLNRPLLGAYELVEQILMTVLGGFAIMYAAIKRGHVAIDLLFARFSTRTKIIIERSASLLGCVTWALLAYEVYLNAMEAIRRGDITNLLRIRTGPFFLALSVALFLYCLTLLIQTSHPAAASKKSEETEAPPDEF